MTKYSVTPEMIADVVQQRLAGVRWAAIEETSGVPRSVLLYHCERHGAGLPIAPPPGSRTAGRPQRQCQPRGPQVVSHEAIAFAARREAERAQASLTAQFCGDPEPCRSALGRTLSG